jgi:cytochrome P450
VRRWIGRRVLSSATGTRGKSGSAKSGLVGMSVVPKKLTMPLRRDGVDPVPALGALREASPVHKLSRALGMNVWVVSGYDEARSVLADSVNYSSDIRALTGTQAAIGGLGFTDPPEHTRLRKLLTPEFTVRRLEGLLPRIEAIVEDRLDAMEASGDVVDLVSQFAFQVPFQVICELLGLPVEDRERFRLLGQARFDVTGGGATTFGAMSESREFLIGAVARQRAKPEDGLIGVIINSAGDEVDDVAIAGLADGVFLGGYETSASMLALGALCLLQDPEAMRLIREDDGATDRIVDELLRYLSVVQISFPRFARHDLTLFGQKVKAGDVVVCSLSGANRDAKFGDDPDRFDPLREGGSHLAFGHGFHRCVGSELARMELRVAFRALARRFPDMTLAVDASELKFRDLSIVYGVESLPVRLGAAARVPR